VCYTKGKINNVGLKTTLLRRKKMSFIDKLERKYPKLGIPNLIFYILFGQVLVFLLTLLGGSWIYNTLSFNRALILRGEVWRLISFIFIPNSLSLLWFILSVFIYYSIGKQLETVFGTLRFTLYYFSSILATVIVAFIFNVTGPIALYINMSFFLTLATLNPELTFYFYGIIPIKAKWLIMLYFVQFAYVIYLGGFITFCLIAASLTGYIFFSVIPYFQRGKGHKFKSNYPTYKKIQRPTPVANKEPIKVAFHHCNVCGITELDNSDMDFRYCSTCGKEFCSEHLKNHTH
jgi:membrane associated rhomboid family serine protease